MTVIPILVGAFETVFEGLEKSLWQLEISGIIETIQISAFLRSTPKEKGPRDLRRLAVT